MQTINKSKFEKRFKELFFDQIHRIKIILDYKQNGGNFYYKIYFNKNGEYLGDYDQKNNRFWLSNKRIWSKLESEFTLNYMDVRDLTKGILGEYYNLINLVPTRNLIGSTL